LNVFDHVNIIARSQLVVEPKADWSRVDGEKVSLSPLPYYQGPVQYLFKLPALKRMSRQYADKRTAALFRVGSPIADLIIPSLVRRNQPYAVEVVGDPWDVFSPGTTSNPARPLFRRWFARSLRNQCSQACAAAYVTKQALQRRYPPKSDALTTHYSSIQLTRNQLATSPRCACLPGSTIRLVTVGTMDLMYKGFDTLIDAVAMCIHNNGMDISLKIIGDGRYRTELDALVRERGLSGRVFFTGQLPSGDAVNRELLKSDLFVLASRQEGLPRALIEAMASGLPCIASNVGGIPELLDEANLVDPDDPSGLSNLINVVVSDPERMAAMSKQNLEQAANYSDDRLTRSRDMLYSHLKKCTQDWMDLEDESP